jgi:hypothetical protein
MEMTDTIMLLASLVSFGVLLIGWMIMPTDVVTEETAERMAMPSARTV